MENNNNFQPLVLNDSELFLNQLKGKKIVDIGFVGACEGGLTIDYLDEGKIKRMILGFTELGMWLHWHGEKGEFNQKAFNQENVLVNKIKEFLSQLNWESQSIKLKDNPLERTFTIEEGNAKLDLSIIELKTISLKKKEILAEFCKAEKDVNVILGLLSDYAYAD